VKSVSLRRRTINEIRLFSKKRMSKRRRQFRPFLSLSLSLSLSMAPNSPFPGSTIRTKRVEFDCLPLLDRNVRKWIWICSLFGAANANNKERARHWRRNMKPEVKLPLCPPPFLTSAGSDRGVLPGRGGEEDSADKAVEVCMWII
jgi:hypothetical protein